MERNKPKTLIPWAAGTICTVIYSIGILIGIVASSEDSRSAEIIGTIIGAVLGFLNVLFLYYSTHIMQKTWNLQKKDSLLNSHRAEMLEASDNLRFSLTSFFHLCAIDDEIKKKVSPSSVFDIYHSIVCDRTFYEQISYLSKDNQDSPIKIARDEVIDCATQLRLTYNNSLQPIANKVLRDFHTT